MKITLFCLLFSLSWLVSAQTIPQPHPELVALLKSKLNSDRIEYFFGSYGVEVLGSCSDIFPKGRISNLYSLEEDKKVMRTLAIVDFSFPLPEPLQSVHKNIQKGASIGIALRNEGWQISKEPLFFGEILLSDGVLKKMKQSSPLKAAVHVYQLNVAKADDLNFYTYCTIVEIHSPQYLTLDWLKALYKQDYQNHHSITQNIKYLLERINACQKLM